MTGTSSTPSYDPIAAIGQRRDDALASIDAAANALSQDIANTTQTGPYLTQLTQRYQDLLAERNAIFMAATDDVLKLPSVIQAAGQLGAIAARMKAIATTLPAATNVLAEATGILSLGQQFAGVIATAQKA